MEVMQDLAHSFQLEEGFLPGITGVVGQQKLRLKLGSMNTKKHKCNAPSL